ncbi:Mitogen-activated protein kinase 9 [Glycine soja]
MTIHPSNFPSLMFHPLHFTFTTHTVCSQSPSSSTTRISILSFSLSWLLLPFLHQRSPSRHRSLSFRSPCNGRPRSSCSHCNPPAAALHLPPPTTAVSALNTAAGTPCCTSSLRSPIESIPIESPSGTPPLTIASALTVATRIGIGIASTDISRKSMSKSASSRFSSIQLEYFATLECYTYVGEGKLPNDPKDRPSAKETLSNPYFTGLANMNCEPSTQPISKLEFEFERRKLTKDDVRELIYGEILEYHPQMLQEYLRGGDQTSFILKLERVGLGNMHTTSLLFEAKRKIEKGQEVLAFGIGVSLVTQLKGLLWNIFSGICSLQPKFRIHGEETQVITVEFGSPNKQSGGFFNSALVLGRFTVLACKNNSKFLWMVRIGGGEYRVDKGAAPKMLNCLINRIPEAALMARSYLPSMISVTIWRKDLSKHPLCVPPPKDPMEQAVGMEDPPTSMYNLFAPIEDDPYVPIAPVSPVHDFVIPPIPPLCYPYAPVPYKGYGPLIPRVHFRDPPPSPIAPKTPIHPPIPVPSPNRQSDMPKG